MQYGMARCTRQVRPRDRCDGGGVKIVKVIWWIPTSSRKPSVPRFSGCFGTRKRSTANYFVKWMASTSFLPAEAAGTLPDRERPYSRQPSGQRKQSTSVDKIWQKYSLFWSTERERKKAGGIWWNLPGFLRQTPLYPSGFGVAGAYSREAFEGEHPLERMSEEEARMFQRGSHSLPLCPAMPGYSRLCPRSHVYQWLYRYQHLEGFWRVTKTKRLAQVSTRRGQLVALHLNLSLCATKAWERTVRYQTTVTRNRSCGERKIY